MEPTVLRTFSCDEFPLIFVTLSRQNDRVGFGEAMGFYIAFNLVQTCFGVCRQICFSIMGKRIGYKSRNVLFSAILRQDIAFFDGMSTGQLTARLGQDLMQMLQPLNW